MVRIIQGNYDALLNASNLFVQQASQIESMTQQVSGCVQRLAGGGWIGTGANAFFEEMDNLVFPGLKRLTGALQEASQVVKTISQIFRDAEEEAGRCFDIDGGAGMAGAGAAGAFAGAAAGAFGGLAGAGFGGVAGAIAGAAGLAGGLPGLAGVVGVAGLVGGAGAAVAAGIQGRGAFFDKPLLFGMTGADMVMKGVPIALKGLNAAVTNKLVQKFFPGSSWAPPPSAVGGLKGALQNWAGNLGKVGKGASKAGTVVGAVIGVGQTFLEAGLTGNWDAAKIGGQLTAVGVSAGLNYATGGIYGLVDLAATGVGMGASKLGDVVTNNANWLGSGDPTKTKLATMAGNWLKQGGESLSPTGNIEKIATSLYRGDFKGAGKAFLNAQLAVPKIVAGSAISAHLALDRTVYQPVGKFVKNEVVPFVKNDVPKFFTKTVPDAFEAGAKKVGSAVASGAKEVGGAIAGGAKKVGKFFKGLF